MIYLALLAVALIAAFGCTLGRAEGAKVADVDLSPIPRKSKELATMFDDLAPPSPKIIPYSRISKCPPYSRISKSPLMKAIETGDAYTTYKLAKCSACLKHLDSDPLAASRCSQNPDCFERWVCSEECTTTCLDCHPPVKVSERDTLLNDAMDIIERKSWMPSVLQPTLGEYVRFFPRFIREVADTLEQAAGDLKEGGYSRLLERALENAKLGHAVSAPIWGVTVLEDTPRVRKVAPEGRKEGLRELLSDFARPSQTPGIEELQRVGLRMLLLDYVNPSRLFPDDTEVRSIDQELRAEITGKGGIDARTVFLSQLAKVRTLALRALPDIRIHTVSVGILAKSSNQLQALASCLSDWCSWNKGTNDLDISATVVIWLRSLADTMESSLNRLLDTESELQRAQADGWIQRVITLSDMMSVLLNACVVRWGTVMYQHLKDVSRIISVLSKVRPRTPPASR